jgi:hypothetical protein
MPIKIEEVFGVRAKQVLSYIERPEVDDRFVEGLKTDKQIVVYGASKQGKTSLVAKHLPYESNIVVSITPKTQLTDIYSSILRQAGVQIASTSSETNERESSVGFGAKFKAFIPIFGGAEANTDAQVKAGNKSAVTYQEVAFNLELPQDISELLKKVGNKKSVILENFHYLDEERQRHFAFDLRTFQEVGLRFVILGVWREKNRLAQFNGDLLDRVLEVPVEPWKEDDFVRVAAQGSKHLQVEFADYLLKKCSAVSFSSIGVFQEIIKETCIISGIVESQPVIVRIENENCLDTAIRKKSDDYASRHQRALEAVAAGNISTSGKDGVQPLFLPYYLVKILLEAGYDGVATGMRRAIIQERIQAMHHRPADVRGSDMSNLLHNLAALQNNKQISPPIFDYDQTTKQLQIVDSTLYFFLKNADLKKISNEIPNPLEK